MTTQPQARSRPCSRRANASLRPLPEERTTARSRQATASSNGLLDLFPARDGRDAPVRKMVDTTAELGPLTSAHRVDVATVDPDRRRTGKRERRSIRLRRHFAQLDPGAAVQHLLEQLERLGVRPAAFPEEELNLHWHQWT